VLTSDGYHLGVVYNWAIAFVVNVILNIILIPEYGIQGAAIASSAAVTLVAILNILLLFWEWRRNNA
jgi:O-antigen/teichoic acid export membrane protein